MLGGIRRNSREGAKDVTRAALLSMRDEDLRVRGELVASGALGDTYDPRMEEASGP